MSSETAPSHYSDPTTGHAPLIPTLPIMHRLRWSYLFSLLIGMLTAVAAVAGLVYPDTFYPTEELRQMALANDILTLCLGLPMLFGSMWLTSRGKLIGLLFWPGALFYGLYNYLTYLYAMPLTALFPLYLFIVTLSVYTTIALAASIDSQQVRQRLNGRIPEKVGGGVLFLFGILFLLRSVAEIVGALSEQTPMPRTELGLVVTDFVICAAWVIGGVLLWRKRPFGYVGGPALLFLTSLLFIGVIAIVLLQPVLTGSDFNWGDFLVLTGMGLISFIPLFMTTRGLLKA